MGYPKTPADSFDNAYFALIVPSTASRSNECRLIAIHAAKCVLRQTVDRISELATTNWCAKRNDPGEIIDDFRLVCFQALNPSHFTGRWSRDVAVIALRTRRRMSHSSAWTPGMHARLGVDCPVGWRAYLSSGINVILALPEATGAWIAYWSLPLRPSPYTGLSNCSFSYRHTFEPCPSTVTRRAESPEVPQLQRGNIRRVHSPCGLSVEASDGNPSLASSISRRATD